MMKKNHIDIEENAAADQTAAQNAAPADDAAQTAEASHDAEPGTDPLEEAEKKIEQLKDQVLRQAAEFDNYRKRTLKEKSELILNGGAKVISALLPILDDLERAKANLDKTDDIETLKEGINLILSKMEKALAAQGLQKIDAMGKTFDTDFHEAIALVPATEDAQKGCVIDCTQTGYTLNDKVIRHAKVVVAQ